MDSDDEKPVIKKEEKQKPPTPTDESSYLLGDSTTAYRRRVEQSSAYQSVIRWIAREDILKKLTAYIFSESFHHTPGATFAEKVGNHLHFLFRSESVPQAFRAAYSRINASDVFVDSLNFVSEKIWLPVFQKWLVKWHQSI